MNAIKILEDQHREVEQLFKAFKALGDEAFDEKYDLFTQIADALALHAAIEEKVFYPSVLANETEEVLREAVQEHLSVKRLLADLLDLEANDEEFDAKMTVLEEQVLHHVKEEESEMLPKVRKMFEADSLEQLGVQMENLAAELLAEGEPSKNIPNEIEQAAPLQ